MNELQRVQAARQALPDAARAAEVTTYLLCRTVLRILHLLCSMPHTSTRPCKGCERSNLPCSMIAQT